MKSPLTIYKRPRLRDPYLILGWADSGLVGTSTIDYLVEKLGAEEFGEIEPYDFSPLPNSLIKEGVLQEIEYPASTFYYCKNKESANDLIMFASKPPAVNHYRLANLILDVAELCEVRRIYTAGGIYANVTHSEKPRVFAVTNNPALKRWVKRFGADLGVDYYGPTSMNGLILGVAKSRKIDGISLWGRVPNYISEIPNPQVCQAILMVLTRMLGIKIDFSEIEAEARHSSKQIEELVSYVRQQDPELDQHIEKLERGMSVEASEEDKQRFFEEIEEFLRQQKGRR